MAGRPLRRARAALNNPSPFWSRNVGRAVEHHRLNREKLFSYNLAQTSDRDLSGLDLKKLDMGLAYLEGADLQKSDLSEANLASSNLLGADMRGANLSKAILVTADLSRADLRGADLRGANLRGAKLMGTVLKRALLQGADLRNADLRHAKFGQAHYNEKTQWPEGFNPENAGGVLETTTRSTPARATENWVKTGDSLVTDFVSIGDGIMNIEIRFVIFPFHRSGTEVPEYLINVQHQGQPRLSALRAVNAVVNAYLVGHRRYSSVSAAQSDVRKVMEAVRSALKENK